MRVVYNLLLILLSPLIILWARGNRRLREGFTERLGRWAPEKRAALGSISGRCIWLHGVSVGEVKLLFPLIRELRARLKDTPLFITTTTETGHGVLKGLPDEEEVIVSRFPLADLPWAIGRFVALLRPRVFVAAEAEAWPNLLAALGRAGARRVLVNARLYLKGKPAWRLWLYRWLYQGFDTICCQHAEAEAAFARIGVPPERLVVTGNMKTDAGVEPWDIEVAALFKERFSWNNNLVVTAGSTHPGEEELILRAFERVKLEYPEWVLALVPRHPDRGEEVLALAGSMRFTCERLSLHKRPASPLNVLVADEMGVLVSFYQIAEVVVLGGTFNPKIGGHNIVEPASLGKPVIVGPYVDSIAAEVEQLSRSHAVVRARDGDDLTAALVALMGDRGRRQALGKRAQAVFAESVGAVATNAGIIISQLATRPEASSR